MGLATVVPGRYTASIKDWGLQDAEHLEGQIEIWIAFDFKDQAGGMQSITWKKLVMTKDGKRAKNVNMALEACGMEPDDEGNIDLVRFMDADALNMQEQVDITISDQPSKDGSKMYKVVEWVNKLGGGQMNKMTGDEKQTMAQRLVSAGLGKAPKKKAPPKNHAPGAGTGANDDEPLPF